MGADRIFRFTVASPLILVLLAAGKGTRTLEPVAKQFLELGGKPVLIHALSKFQGLAFGGTKFVSVHPEDITFVQDLLTQHRITPGWLW